MLLNMQGFKGFRRASDMHAGVRLIVVVLALTAAIVPLSARCQNKQPDKPDLRGVWISTNTALEDPRWSIEDRVCGRCALPALDRLHAVLNDPKSANRPLKEIAAEIGALNKKYVTDQLTHSALAYQATFTPANDPVLACKPVGLFSQEEGTLPMKIEQYADKIVFHYEYFGSVRTVYLDGRG
ncbi:MAG: hypothetical protein ACREU6_09800, partial [Steroidobacteraceae bacterium]